MSQFQDIPQYSTWVTIKKIEKGWSPDTKYYIQDNNGEEYLLRTSPISHYDAKKAEFDMVNHLFSLKLNMSKPIDFGVFNNKSKVYILLTYIPGDQAEILLKNLSKELQYNLGFEMGQQLKKIHSINYTDKTKWKEWYVNRIYNRIELYNKCGINQPIIEDFKKYLINNLNVLDNRPTCQNHGDFHVGNMIISPDNNIHIIDFNRIKIGDPIYEYNRIHFSYRISPQFAKGQIDGYFDKNIPDYFFKLMKFYILSVGIGSIAWAKDFGQKDIDYALRANQEIYDEYNQLTSDIPNWYKEL